MAVYFIATADGDLVKIGQTDRSCAERAQELARHAKPPQALALIAELEGDYQVEAYWQSAFRDLNAKDAAKDRGLQNPIEWFLLEGDLLDLINTIREGATAKDLCPGPWELDTDKVPDREVLLKRDSEEAVDAEESAEALLLEQLAAIPITALNAEMARRRFSEFAKQAWHIVDPGVELEWNWHHQMLCDTMQAFVEAWLHTYRTGKPLFVQNMAINIPPGTLKSKIIMTLLLPWIWLHEPSFKMAALSANPTNVKRDSDACRDLVLSPWYRDTFKIEWEIRDDIDSKEKYKTTAGGERVSRGLGANPVGMHVDCIVVDDPDDTKTVFSDVIRQGTHDDWDRLSNRVVHGGKSIRIIVQHATHSDDLTSYVRSRGGDWSPTNPTGWAIIRLPLEYDLTRHCTTPWGWSDPRTTTGECLHPQRFTPEVIAAERKSRGNFGFETLYNQNPKPLQGGLFKRDSINFFRYDRECGGSEAPVRRPVGCRAAEDAPTFVVPSKRVHRGGQIISIPAFDRVAITVDASNGSTRERASRNGILVIGSIGAKRFIIDDRTRKMNFLDTVKVLKQVCMDYPEAASVFIEAKAMGPQCIEELREAGIGGIKDHDPDGSKEQRAAAMEPAIAAGDLYVLEGARWLEDAHDEGDEGFIEELCSFPNVKNDDRVDALAQCMDEWRASTRILNAYAW